MSRELGVSLKAVAVVLNAALCILWGLASYNELGGNGKLGRFSERNNCHGLGVRDRLTIVTNASH